MNAQFLRFWREALTMRGFLRVLSPNLGHQIRTLRAFRPPSRPQHGTLQSSADLEGKVFRNALSGLK